MAARARSRGGPRRRGLRALLAKARAAAETGALRRAVRRVAAIALASWAETTPGLDGSRALTQYRLDTWGVRDGLPHAAVSQVLQDKDGYLLLATSAGPARFDGVKFATPSGPAQIEPLAGAQVTRMFAVKDGSLWIAARGRGLVRRHGGRDRVYTTADGLPSGLVSALHEDSEGSLWAGTSAGLARQSPAEPHRFVRDEGVPAVGVFALHRDRRGELWVGTDAGLFRRTAEGWTRYGVAEGLGDEHVFHVAEDREGVVWIGTRGGLFAWRDGRIDRFTSVDGLSHDTVRAILEDRDGVLWIGTAGGGLNRLHAGRFESLRVAQGLPSDIVLSLFEDREGSLWIATGGGLARIANTAFVAHTTREGLAGDFVWTITEAADGALWIGTNGAGLSRLQDGGYDSYGAAHGLSNTNVLSVLESGGRIVAGTYDGLFASKGGRFELLSGAKAPRRAVRSLFEDRDAVLWIGSEEGLTRLTKDGFEQVAPEALRDTSVVALRQDAEGRLWVGTERGRLYVWDGTTLHDRTALLGPDRYPVRDIWPAPDGSLWIATLGLVRIKDDQALRIGRAEGFFDTQVNAIVAEGEAQVWFSTEHGVARIAWPELAELGDGRRRSASWQRFGEADGMRSAECNGGTQPSAWRTRDGRMLFPTMRGVAAAAALAAAAPGGQPALLEAVVVDGRALDQPAPIRLPPGSRRFEFRYTSLSLAMPDAIRFRYRIDPLEADWLDAGSRRTAFYNDLPPGRHRFRVAASLRDGPWIEAEPPFEFVLEPRVFERLGFRLAAAGVLLGLLWLGHGLFVRALRERQRELTRLLAEQGERLEAANEQVQSVSRELETFARRDALTAVANRGLFDERFPLEYQRALRSWNPLALVLLDIDHFKAFNEQYGHQQGDECLARVASVVSRVARRAADLVARYGAEEFAVVLPETALEEALRLAETLRKDIEACSIPHEASGVSRCVTVSVGVAALDPGRYHSPQELLAAVEAALQRAKQAGRNRVESAADSRV